MARKGESPADFRSESERLGPRPRRREYVGKEDTSVSRREELEVPNHFAIRARNEDQGRAPEQPKGERDKPPRFSRMPRGYTRSDKRIWEDACDLLYADPGVDASEIAVQVHEGHVVLSGSVDSRNTKYYVEELIDRVFGVEDVENRLKMRRGDVTESVMRGADAGRLREDFSRKTKMQ